MKIATSNINDIDKRRDNLIDWLAEAETRSRAWPVAASTAGFAANRAPGASDHAPAWIALQD